MDKNNSTMAEIKHKKIGIILFFFVQIFLLVVGIYFLKRPYYSYSCQGEELVTNGAIFLHDFIDGLQDGYYIDDTMVTEEIIADDDLSLYIATPGVDLTKGSYEVSIYYNSQENRNTYTVSSKHNTRDIRINNVRRGVNGEDGCHVFGFETSQDVEDYQVKVEYCNSNYLFVNKIDITETNDWRCKTFICIIVIIAIMNLIFITKYKGWKLVSKECVSIVIVLGTIAILAGLPVLYRGIYWGHDTFVHVARMEGLKEALKEGIFPVRMQNFFFNGYGYPISIYYGDLLLYIPAMLRMVGFDVQTCFNGYILMINFLTCITMYFAVSKIFNNKTYGVIAAFIYVLAPYRLSCTYLRGAIGETTAMLFYPLIVYGLYKIFTENKNSQKDKLDWIWLSLGFSGLVYSHMISTIVMGIFTFIVCVVFIKKTFSKEVFSKLCKAVGLAVLLCAEFLIPILEYLGADISMNQVERYGMFQGHGAYLGQLFTIFSHGNGSAFSDTMMLENEVEMSYSIGIIFVCSLLIYLLCLINHKVQNNKISNLGKTLFGISLLAIWMSSIYFPWDVIEQMGAVFATITKTIQFPWRILSVATIALSILTICVIDEIKKLYSREVLYSFMTCAILGTLFISGYWMNDFMNSSEMLFRKYTYEVSDRAVGQGEYMPDDIDSDMFEDLSLWHNENVAIDSMNRTNSKITINCTNISNQEQYIDVPFIYYRDYVAKDVGTREKLQTVVGEGKRVRVIIPEGYTGSFEVGFVSPWYWRLCEVISLGTFIILCVFAYLKNREKKAESILSNC